MRGKDYSTGLRGVLFEAQHYERMGAALWLYGWLVLRQTHQHGSVGWVLGGAPVNYREIEDETGFNRRTLERWMHTLRRHGYIETEAAPGGLIVRITKAKKFSQVPRKAAERLREIAGGGPQICGGSTRKVVASEQFAGGIDSSFVERTVDRSTLDFHKRENYQTSFDAGQDQTSIRNPNRPGLGERQNHRLDAQSTVQSEAEPQQQQNFSFDERMRRQWLRAEREEAVRRELAAGAGPEVPRR